LSNNLWIWHTLGDPVTCDRIESNGSFTCQALLFWGVHQVMDRGLAGEKLVELNRKRDGDITAS
jgi:hypothetical protein